MEFPLAQAASEKLHLPLHFLPCQALVQQQQGPQQIAD